MHMDLVSLNSDYFRLFIEPGSGTWGLASEDGGVRFENSIIRCTWRNEAQRITSETLKRANAHKLVNVKLSPGLQGTGYRMHSIDDDGLIFSTDFLLSEKDPLCLLRLRIENQSRQPVRLERVDFLGHHESSRSYRQPRIRSNSVMPEANPNELRFMAHGWQSWSYAGVLMPNNKFPRSRLGPLSNPMHQCCRIPHPRKPGRQISDFYGALLDIRNAAGLLLGFLSQSKAFGRVVVDFSHSDCIRGLFQELESIQLPVGEIFTTDWACIHKIDLRQKEPLSTFMRHVASIAGVKNIRKPVTGWCSWYCFGQDISMENIAEQLEWMGRNRDDVPLGLFQIDDGYQRNIGDWERDDSRFPEPLSKYVEKIHAASLQAGIWIAPLIAIPGSTLVREHPEWLLRDRSGKPVNAGFGWGRFFYALDGTHPGVMDAIDLWIAHTVATSGFDYLKLDFLYAGALMGQRRDDRKTGAMVLREVLSRIREIAGEDTFLVGCGCPLGSGIGLVDSMRVGPDVSENWKGRYKGISLLLNRDPGYPSAWNSIRNIYYRAHQHNHWWLNDPDCLILREEKSNLDEAEVRTLTTMIALCGGVVVDSDSLHSLSQERVGWLARLIPPIAKRPIQPTLFDPDRVPIVLHHMQGAAGEWTLAAVFNFTESAKTTIIDCGTLGFKADEVLSGFEFWQHTIRRFSGERWTLGKIPPHGVALWALRRVSNHPVWLGDTIHISQGLPLSTWEVGSNQVSASINAGRSGEERVWMIIPGAVRSAVVDDVPVKIETIQPNTYSFRIQLSNQNKVHIEWD
jgi:alpha-galactosidase